MPLYFILIPNTYNINIRNLSITQSTKMQPKQRALDNKLIMYSLLQLHITSTHLLRSQLYEIAFPISLDTLCYLVIFSHASKISFITLSPIESTIFVFDHLISSALSSSKAFFIGILRICFPGPVLFKQFMSIPPQIAFFRI